MKTAEKKQARVERRRQEFYDALVPYVEQYGRAMVRDFYDYWTELNPSRTRMRFELQPTWEIKKRLAFWSRHSKNQQHETRHTTDSREDRLRDYAEIAASFRRRSELAQ